MWKPNQWDLKLISSTDQTIHSEVFTYDGKFSHYLIVVYAHNLVSKRKNIWENIKDKQDTFKGPWMIIGDFNNVLKVNDIIGRMEVHLNEYVDLGGMMEEVGLTEHSTAWNTYTWSNKQTQGMIYSRIDRAICNTEWYLQYPEIELENLNHHISDHSPLRLSIKNSKN